MVTPKRYYSPIHLVLIHLVLVFQLTGVGGCGRDETPDTPPSSSNGTIAAQSPATDLQLIPAPSETQPSSAELPNDAESPGLTASTVTPSANPPALKDSSPATAPAASQPVGYPSAEIPPGDGPSAPPEPVTAPSSLSPCRPGTEPQPGDWATLAAQDGRHLRYEIVEVAPDAITTRVEAFVNGRPQGQPTIRRDPCSSDLIPPPTSNASAERAVTEALCEAAGRRWRCFRYEDRWTDEDVTYVRYTWVSLEAPLFGIVRMELHGDDTREAELELIDWGPKR